MENEFIKAMSQRTNDELIGIVTIERKNYNQLAIEAAELEIEKRGIEPKVFNEVREAKQTKKEIEHNIDSNTVSSISRFLNFIIDFIAWYVLAFLIATVMSTFMEPSLESGTGIYVLIVILGSFFLYFGVMEYKFQKTLGKFVTKTKVVQENGEKPKISDITARTLYRLIPFDPISFLFVKNGFHDSLSNTRVVKDTME